MSINLTSAFIPPSVKPQQVDGVKEIKDDPQIYTKQEVLDKLKALINEVQNGGDPISKADAQKYLDELHDLDASIQAWAGPNAKGDLKNAEGLLEAAIGDYSYSLPKDRLLQFLNMLKWDIQAIPPGQKDNSSANPQTPAKVMSANMKL